jgi:hypothetical protein
MAYQHIEDYGIIGNLRTAALTAKWIGRSVWRLSILSPRIEPLDEGSRPGLRNSDETRVERKKQAFIQSYDRAAQDASLLLMPLVFSYDPRMLQDRRHD